MTGHFQAKRTSARSGLSRHSPNSARTEAYEELELSVLKSLRDAIYGNLTQEGIRENSGHPNRVGLRLTHLISIGEIAKDEHGFYTIQPPGLARLQKKEQQKTPAD